MLAVIESNSLAVIKLAQLVADPATKVAIKCFCKVTLKQKKEYVRRKDGKGMEVKTQLDKVMQHEVRAITKAAGHPNVVNLFEIIDDEEAGKLMLVMEFVEQGRLLEWQAELGCFKPASWGS